MLNKDTEKSEWLKAVNAGKTEKSLIEWSFNNELVLEKNKKFNKDLIMQKKTVVHCKTKKESEMLLNWAHSQGLSTSYLDKICFEDFKDQTCYNLLDGAYGSLEWYKRENYTIIGL